MTLQTDRIASHSVVIDFLRFSLAAAVAIGHGFGFFLGDFNGFFPRVFPYPQSIAVVCFFFVSGYLVAGSQIRKGGRATIAGYVFDRFTRIYITLLPCLMFVVVVDWALLGPAGAYGDNRTIGIFWHNLALLPSMPFGTMRPIWSLMYEWWIYAVFGGVFFLRASSIPALILLAIGAYYTFEVNATGPVGHIWIVWVFGAVCAAVSQRGLLDRVDRPALAIAVPVLLGAAIWRYAATGNAYDIPAGLMLSSALFLSLRLAVPSERRLVWLSPYASKLAGLSYTLFLTHYTVMTCVAIILHGWTGLVVSLALSMLVAFTIAAATEYRLETVRGQLRRLGLVIVRAYARQSYAKNS